MSRIVQVANFVTPTSGGLRTTLNHLAAGYAEHGHEVIQIVPGESAVQQQMPWGSRISMESTLVPGTGYRVMLHALRVQEVLASTQPDLVEVHDRTTLRGLGTWAKHAKVPSLVVSHERLDKWLQQWFSQRFPLTATADWSNRLLAKNFDRVVCTTQWAAEEFTRIGARNLDIVPLGVDLDSFTPRLSGGLRDQVQLLMVSRLSKEKRPDLAIATVRELRRRGLDVHLTIAGDGPLRTQLEAQSKDLPVAWLGFVHVRADLARRMADADVVLAPGPVETFGLAALESLACGTPVVVNHHSALPEVIGDAGRKAASSGFVMADAVLELLTTDEPVRRQAARRQAETFSWDATVRGFLEVHGQRKARVAS